MSEPIDLKDYRQPMVTSLGVFLGFLAGFLGQWVTEPDFALVNLSDYTVFGGCFTGVFLLFIALFRMLSAKTSTQATRQYYNNTLLLYLCGIVVSFTSILISAFI